MFMTFMSLSFSSHSSSHPSHLAQCLNKTAKNRRNRHQHRRQQAREEGQVAKSQDLGSAVLLLAGLLILLMMGQQLVEFFGGYSTKQLGGEAWLTADPDFAVSQWTSIVWTLAKYHVAHFRIGYVGRHSVEPDASRFSLSAR